MEAHFLTLTLVSKSPFPLYQELINHIPGSSNPNFAPIYLLERYDLGGLQELYGETCEIQYTNIDVNVTIHRGGSRIPGFRFAPP